MHISAIQVSRLADTRSPAVALLRQHISGAEITSNELKINDNPSFARFNALWLGADNGSVKPAAIMADLFADYYSQVA